MVRLASHLAAIAASAAAARACVTIQYNFPSDANAHSTRASAVSDVYRTVWNQYKQEAFGQDYLLPVSMTGQEGLFGWGGTIVDGIDTAVVMGLTDIVEEQLEWIYGVDFSKADSTVDEFDAMIRYVAGLISAYDIINSDTVPKGTYNTTQVNALLKAAVTISDKLKPAFNTTSGLPLPNLNWATDTATDGSSYSVDTAVCGTLILEWFRLSDLTGDTSYADLARKTEANLISPNQTLSFPYIVGSSLDYRTGKYIDQNFGWQAGIDSFYEYLIKAYVYNPTRADTTSYKNYWVGSVQSTEKHLIQQPFQHPNLNFISQGSNGVLSYNMDDYACFAGGNMLLGGQYLGNQDFRSLGIKVTDSCHALFNNSAAGLNPSSWAWFNQQNKTGNPADQNNPSYVQQQKAHGFYDTNSFWGEYPEPVESIWYAYRITGNPIWQEYNWEIFQAFQKDTMNRTKGVSTAELNDVTQPNGGSLYNLVDTFFYAEFLKYLYLTFSPPSLISLDEWVFNTECHPFKIQTGTCATSK